MSMRLARLRDEVRHEIGQLSTTSTIDDAAIDHALAQSLMLLASHYPSTREILTIATAGSTQDLRALAPTMVKLESIQYPYNPDLPRMLSYPHTIVDAHTVVFYTCEPQAGEELLAVFNERHTLDGLFKDKSALRNMLLYHVIAGKLTAADFARLNGKGRKTFEGSDAKIAVSGTQVTVGSANVTKSDIMAKNGIIHIIDMVLLPPGR